MYRIRKEWNNGKWTKEQLGAYSVLQTAIDNCTDEAVMSGYKVFDENGKVVYPVIIDATAQLLIDDGISVDGEYWTDVLTGVVTANPEYLKLIIQRYHEALQTKQPKGYQIEMFGDIPMFNLDISKFKIVWTDKVKLTEIKNTDLAFNLGYFASFSEKGKWFTLPVANLVADIDFSKLSPEAIKYIHERPHTDNRVAFSTYNNSSDQFKGKYVSTLCVKDGEAWIANCQEVTLDGVDYAVSGVPIIRGGKFCEKAYKSEGWDSSVSRPTYHGFIGIRKNSLYYFYLCTTAYNCITSGEIYDLIKLFEFDDVIKVDGGGSFFCDCDEPKYSASTRDERQINNIGGVFNER